MCGIAGIFAYGESAPPVHEAELFRIREAMVKRGPDGAGTWISPDRRIGLANRRLAILDLSDAGAQPMATHDGRLHITFNGEIYNYRDLRKQLERKGYVFRSNSDTEVLLQLYADRGKDMVHALRGMYAFAIWDEREKMLLLARDPFGIKPLYYADLNGTFRFASQLTALLSGGGFRVNPDPAGWAGYFLWGAVPEPLSTWKEIAAVRAGCTVTVSTDRRKAESFFSVIGELERAEAGRPSDRGATAELGQVMEESVQSHLLSDVPVGLFLSAGVDSGVLARLASRRVTELRTITLGFEEYKGSSDDETGGAESLASELNCSHTTHWVSATEFRAVRDEFLRAMDQPTIDGLNNYLVSKVAAEAGLKVVLSGLGGDELFAGYPSFRQVPALARLLAWVPERSGFGRGFRRLTRRAFAWAGVPKYAGLFEYGKSVTGAYLLRRAVYMPWELENVMLPEAARTGLAQLTELDEDEAVQKLRTDAARLTALETSLYMRNMLLRDTDWASMAHSVEIRLPFVDTIVFRQIAHQIGGGRAPSKRDLILAGGPADAGWPSEGCKRGFVVPLHSWNTEAHHRPRGGQATRSWALRVAQARGCVLLRDRGARSNKMSAATDV